MTRLIKKIKNKAKLLIQNAFFMSARDISGGLSPGTVLVIAPHPDDETIGCGATIARLKADGRRVRIVVVTDGAAAQKDSALDGRKLAALRQTETLRAAEALGIPATDIVFLSYPDCGAEDHKAKITDDLAAQIWLCSPSVIFSPYGIDGHPDHRAVADCVQTLLETGKIACALYEYPVWFWPKGAFAHGKIRANWKTHTKVSALEFLDFKKRALAAHKSQIENITGEPNWKITLEPWFLALHFRPYELFFEKRKK